MKIRRGIRKSANVNAGASDLQQAKPLVKKGLCKHKPDAASCKDIDAGEASDRFLNHDVYYIEPMLATLVGKPFDRKGWLFEIKWDGYRALAHKGKEVKLISRGRQSYHARFPEIVKALEKLPGRFVLDGEIVILDKNGRPQFQLLQNYQKHKEGTPYYYLFDILSYEGRDLTRLPLIDRKKILKKLLSASGRSSRLCFSRHVETKGKTFFAQARRKGLEGVIAKKSNSPYQFHCSKDWLKIKAIQRQEVVIGGFTEPKGGRTRFGALLVGVYEKGKLVYAGHVGGGFDRKRLEDVYAELQKIISLTCPFAQKPRTHTLATWVKPKLVCEAAFAEWTSDGIMRMPIFKGMRSDKNPKEVKREKAKKI